MDQLAAEKKILENGDGSPKHSQTDEAAEMSIPIDRLNTKKINNNIIFV